MSMLNELCALNRRQRKKMINHEQTEIKTYELT